MPLLGSLENSPRRRQRVNALHEQEQERLMAQSGRVACDDTGIDDLASTSNWMRRTKWAETYRGVDRRLLIELRQALATCIAAYVGAGEPCVSTGTVAWCVTR